MRTDFAEDGHGDNLVALPRGWMLSEYRIDAVLGQGGFGITYLAYDTLLNEAVALKEYFPNEMAVRAPDYAARPKSNRDHEAFGNGLQAFLEEARIIARFRHPNIMQVRRFFEAHGTGYIVLDFVRGQSLEEAMAAAPLPEPVVLSVFAGILDGLSAVHERAILHRDLKPRNVILRENGVPILIDFGAARDFGARNSLTVTKIASPGYSSPEQYGVGNQQGPWSDFYSLGAILYRAVTGRVPPDALKRLRDDPLLPASKAAAGRYGADLLRLIDRMMQIDESKRPAAAAEIRKALPVLATAHPVPITAATDRPGPAPSHDWSVARTGKPARPAGRGRTWLAVTALVATLAAGMAGGALWLLGIPEHGARVPVAGPPADEALHPAEAPSPDKPGAAATGPAPAAPSQTAMSPAPGVMPPAQVADQPPAQGLAQPAAPTATAPAQPGEVQGAAPQATPEAATPPRVAEPSPVAAPPAPAPAPDVTPPPTPAPVVAAAPAAPAAAPAEQLTRPATLSPGVTFQDCPTCPTVTVLPAGAFDMGSADGPPSERPVHRVTIAAPFAMGQREVTFAQWDACVAAGGCTYRPNDRGWGRGDHPVIDLSWSDAETYVAWLSKTTGEHYRLPSEAEWEYADRAGTKASFWWGEAVGTGHAACANCTAQPQRSTSPAGSFPANPFGLYDTAGNAAEWVEDCWSASYDGAPADGSAVTTGQCGQRVLRGGSFSSDARYLRSASRFKYDANVRYYTNGLRVARDVRLP